MTPYRFLNRLTIRLISTITRFQRVALRITRFIRAPIRLHVTRNQMLVRAHPHSRPLSYTAPNTQQLSSVRPSQILTKSRLNHRKQRRDNSIRTPTLVTTITTRNSNHLRSISTTIRRASRVKRPNFLIIRRRPTLARHNRQSNHRLIRRFLNRSPVRNPLPLYFSRQRILALQLNPLEVNRDEPLK